MEIAFIEDLTPLADFRNAEIAVLAAGLVDGTREARSELGAVTPEELAFAPSPGLHNSGAVLLHHAIAEALWIRCDLLGEAYAEIHASFPEFPKGWSPDRDAWPIVQDLTLEEIYRRSDEVRRDTLSRLADLESPERLTSQGEYRFTARWVVNHLIGHDAYHFGQAVLLVQMARAANP